jgi:hypothetical protein
MKPNAKFIHQFHSDDDHLIPVAEARFVASKLKGANHVYEELSGYSHFFGPFQPLLDCVDTYCGDKVAEEENAAEAEGGTIFQPPPSSWPSLVGVSTEVAAERIRTERPDLKAVDVLPEDSMVTMDFREDRVRVFAAADGTVAREPTVG